MRLLNYKYQPHWSDEDPIKQQIERLRLNETLKGKKSDTSQSLYEIVS